MMNGMLYDPELNIRYTCLSAAQKQFYLDLYKAVCDEKPQVKIPYGIATMQEAFDIMYFFSLDAAELCRYDHRASTVSSSTNNGIKMPDCVNLAYRKDVTKQDQQLFIDELKRVAQPVRGLPVMQALDRLNKALLARVAYSHSDEGHEYVAYYSWKERKGVCDALAQLFCMLCHFAGIPCSWISGETVDAVNPGEKPGLHAWNVVKAGNDYTLCDPTWNRSDFEKGRPLTWLGMSSEHMYRFRHPSDHWYDMILPKNCVELSGRKQIKSLQELRSAIDAGGERVALWLSETLFTAPALHAAARYGLNWKTHEADNSTRTLKLEGCSRIFAVPGNAISTDGELDAYLAEIARLQPRAFRIPFAIRSFTYFSLAKVYTAMARHGIRFNTSLFHDSYCYRDFMDCTYTRAPEVLSTAAQITDFVRRSRNNREIVLHLSDNAYENYKRDTIRCLGAMAGVVLLDSVAQPDSRRISFRRGGVYEHVLFFRTDAELVSALKRVKAERLNFRDCLFVTMPDTAKIYMNNNWERFKSATNRYLRSWSGKGDAGAGCFYFDTLEIA